MRISFSQAERNSLVVLKKTANLQTHTHTASCMLCVYVASSSRMKYETNCSNFPEGDGHANVTSHS